MIFLYGPPGAGKSTLGMRLAKALDCPFVDLDEQIIAATGRAISEIFADEGESGFRQHERTALLKLLANDVPCGVVALGGGALLNPDSRTRVVGAGIVICLSAPEPVLAARLQAAAGTRPLLAGNQVEKLSALLEQRAAHYASFDHQLDTGEQDLETSTWEAQILCGRFHITGMGRPYDVLAAVGGLGDLGRQMQLRGLKGPVALVTDDHVGPVHGWRVIDSLNAAGYTCQAIEIPAGEQHKTLPTVNWLWDCFISAGLDRGCTVVALGGGVVTDLAGFAAATYLRGLPWVAVPTTLLAMCDASLGGKTGVDLPQGKNLVGAFYPPSLVLADPLALCTLSEPELRSGMAEVVKHGLLGDSLLFRLCQRGWSALQADWGTVVRRAMAVKVRVILEDPYEKGRRAVLNLGHTLGHAVELASDFKVRHGEAVAIGMMAAAHFAVWGSLAQPSLVDELGALLNSLGLPTAIPIGLDRARFLAALRQDKKRQSGQVRFVLPCRIGEALTGQDVPEEWIERFRTMR